MRVRHYRCGKPGTRRGLRQPRVTGQRGPNPTALPLLTLVTQPDVSMKPVLLLAASVALAISMSSTSLAAVRHQPTPPGPPPPRVIEVVAKRFTFEPATIEVVEGERIRLLVRSADGVHGIRIRNTRVNTLIPRGGKPVTVDFVAPAAGKYQVLCSEECGDGHESMTGSLVVQARPAGGQR